MLLRHHDIENKNLTFSNWLQIAKKKNDSCYNFSTRYTETFEGSFLESTCNLLLNETKQCSVWTMFSLFKSFMTT